MLIVLESLTGRAWALPVEEPRHPRMGGRRPQIGEGRAAVRRMLT